MEKDFHPYLEAGLGFYDDDGAEFGINGGGGVEWEVAERFYIGPMGRVHVIFSGDAEFSAGVSFSYRF